MGWGCWCFYFVGGVGAVGTVGADGVGVSVCVGVVAVVAAE